MDVSYTWKLHPLMFTTIIPRAQIKDKGKNIINDQSYPSAYID